MYDIVKWEKNGSECKNENKCKYSLNNNVSTVKPKKNKKNVPQGSPHNQPDQADRFQSAQNNDPDPADQLFDIPDISNGIASITYPVNVKFKGKSWVISCKCRLKFLLVELKQMAAFYKGNSNKNQDKNILKGMRLLHNQLNGVVKSDPE